MAGSGGFGTLFGELEALEAVQLLLDRDTLRKCLRHEPGPLLDQQFLPLPVRFEVERRHHPVAGENRQREIAQHPFAGRHIGLEAMLVAEKQGEALALDDQRIEGRQDMDKARRLGVRKEPAWTRGGVGEVSVLKMVSRR